MYRKALVLVWFFSFVLAELLGISLAYLVYLYSANEVVSGTLADIITVAVRFLSLAYIAKVVDISMSSAIYKPLPSRRSAPLLLILIAVVALIDYYVSSYGSGGIYEPQLLDYSRYVGRNVIWGFPFKITYYFSEITVMNYMYVLARRVWGELMGLITGGTLFLVLGWALLHVFTKNLIVAVYAVVLVLFFYTGYENTRSPLTPVILWFTVLIV